MGRPIRKKGADREEKPRKEPTEVIRVPELIADMLEVIAQHRVNGWGSVPEILRDDDCPLRDWLMPFYVKALEEKMRRAKEVKGS